MTRALIVISFFGLNAVNGFAYAQTAADAYYSPEEMAAARHHLYNHHGNGRVSYIEAERLEYRTGEGESGFLWDGQGWIGGDDHKVWLKTEGEIDFDGSSVEEAEVQLLYSRAISSFFDAQIGIRHDIKPNPSRTYAVVGLQGLTPYHFELDAATFISDKGDVSARIEAEYELLLTQRLIAQPRTELNIALQDTPSIDVGSGLSTVELGVRLRYEIKREIAPYIGVSWERSLGDTADFARENGDDPSTVFFVAGVRSWF